MLNFHEKTTTIWDYFIIKKRYLGLKTKKRVERSKRDFERMTGYTWDDFLNAVTVASLIQISIKLLLSIFGIKIALWVNLCSLLFFTSLCLFFNLFIAFKFFIIKVLKKTINPFFYNAYLPRDIDLTELDTIDMTDWNYNKTFNTFFLYAITEKILMFFIFVRLCFFFEPLLFNLSKFVLLTWFLYDYNLFLAYLLSFLIIFSRFLFFLSDKNYLLMKKPFIDFYVQKIDNIENSILPNYVNTKIISHWALRIIENNDGKSLLKHTSYSYFCYLLAIMETEKKDFPKIKGIKPNTICKYLFYILVLITFCFVIEKFQNTIIEGSVKIRSIVTPLRKPYKNAIEKAVMQKAEGHATLRIETIEDNDFIISNNTLTTIKPKGPNFAFVPKKQLNDSQGISLLSYETRLNKQQYLEMTNKENELMQQGYYDKAKYTKYSETDLLEMLKEIKEKRIHIDLNYLPLMSDNQQKFLQQMCSFVDVETVPLAMQHCFWSFVQINHYDERQQKMLLKKAIHFLNLLPHNSELRELQPGIAACLQDITCSKPPRFFSEENFEKKMTEADSFLNTITKTKNTPFFIQSPADSFLYHHDDSS